MQFTKGQVIDETDHVLQTPSPGGAYKTTIEK
jgi:hypothetical protein